MEVGLEILGFVEIASASCHVPAGMLVCGVGVTSPHVRHLYEEFKDRIGILYLDERLY